MGQAKLKQYNRQQFLSRHQLCAYCGTTATTTDHCPPRCLFVRRVWPEGYEFPACESCNKEARLDEQALAFLFRIKLNAEPSKVEEEEIERLISGIANNQPDLFAEWRNVSRNETRRSLRNLFGGGGDHFRSQGWGTLNGGPLTKAIVSRFLVKLAKALYYRHNEKIFEGIVYAQHFSIAGDNTPVEQLIEMLRLAPTVVSPSRSRQSLEDQFVYRLNNNAEYGTLYSVVQFSEQFMFQLIVLRSDFADRLETDLTSRGDILPKHGRHICVLKHRPSA